MNPGGSPIVDPEHDAAQEGLEGDEEEQKEEKKEEEDKEKELEIGEMKRTARRIERVVAPRRRREMTRRRVTRTRTRLLCLTRSLGSRSGSTLGG